MEEIEKSEEIVKPLSAIYADAKQALTQQINRTMGAYSSLFLWQKGF